MIIPFWNLMGPRLLSILRGHTDVKELELAPSPLLARLKHWGYSKVFGFCEFLSRRERVAAKRRVRGEETSLCTPHPVLRTTLSLRERDSPRNLFQFGQQAWPGGVVVSTNHLNNHAVRSVLMLRDFFAVGATPPGQEGRWRSL